MIRREYSIWQGDFFDHIRVVRQWNVSFQLDGRSVGVNVVERAAKAGHKVRVRRCPGRGKQGEVVRQVLYDISDPLYQCEETYPGAKSREGLAGYNRFT